MQNGHMIHRTHVQIVRFILDILSKEFLWKNECMNDFADLVSLYSTEETAFEWQSVIYNFICSVYRDSFQNRWIGRRKMEIRNKQAVLFKVMMVQDQKLSGNKGAEHLRSRE